MRLFVGIPLSDNMARELAAMVEPLRSSAGAGHDELRWTAPESWHITLQFLGNASEEQFACLLARLAEVHAAPVPVRFGDMDCFDRAGVFIAGVAVTPALAALQQRVVAATSRCGFQAEARPFHPHITLARKARAELRGLISKAGTMSACAPFTAHEFLLYESHLGAVGSRYEVKMRVQLDAS